jgi:hypothetical protein
MKIRSLSILSGSALLALTMTASAGPMSIAGSGIVGPPTQIEKTFYRGHAYGRPGLRYGARWGYGRYGLAGAAAVAGAYGWRYGERPYWGYGRYGYGGPVTEPLVAGEAVGGDYCATPVKTCLLYEPGVLGTGCSCKVSGGRARGVVQ